MRIFRILSFVVGLLVVVFVTSCAVSPITTISQTQIPKTDCEKQAQEWQDWENGNLKYFEKGEVIVIAPSGMKYMNQVIELLKPISYTESITISTQGQDDFQIQRFQLEGEFSYSQTIEKVCEINNIRGVYADPNYVISIAGHGPAVSAIAGWSENHETWRAMPRNSNHVSTYQEGQFGEQWAWGPNPGGINFDPNIQLTGQGVSVAILDTISADTSPKTPIENHGTFVKGIIGHIARNSQVITLSVVDSDGQGDLYRLLKSVYELQPDQSKNLVINLSLGVAYPRQRCPYGGCDINNRYLLGEHGLPDDIVALEKTLRWAFQQGSVIISAAGNLDNIARVSGEVDDKHPKYLTIPTDYEFVLGVASTNNVGIRSCFSHKGEVYAPGGDGVELELIGGGGYTQCAVPDYDNIKNGIISTMQDESGRIYYTLWAGTSFSAPMVSGLAALLLEAGVKPHDVPQVILDCAMSYDPKDYDALHHKLMSYEELLYQHMSDNRRIDIPQFEVSLIDIEYTLTHYQNPNCQ